MEYWIMLATMVFMMWLFYAVVKAITKSATNVPTWKGVIVSSLLGVLPFYLFMCWLGVWGEAKQNSL